MTRQQLAEHLNERGIKTSYNTLYSGGRGVNTLITAVWYMITESINMETAYKVAFAFPNNPEGDYSFDYEGYEYLLTQFNR